MTFLAKHFDSMLSVDWPTLAVIVVFCALASYVLKEYLANPPMIIFVFPLLVFFSILTQYIFISMDLFPPKKLDQWLMWTIMSAIIGTILGTGVVACLVRLRERLGHRPS